MAFIFKRARSNSGSVFTIFAGYPFVFVIRAKIFVLSIITCYDVTRNPASFTKKPDAIVWSSEVFKSEAIKSINLKENSFGIEPEITIKLAKKKFKFYEVAVSYRGRSYSEGKKITLKDAFWAVYCILRYRFFD